MVQKERDGLEGAKIEAEKFINIEREVLINKGYLLKKQLYVENDQLKTIGEKKEALEKKYEDLDVYWSMWRFKEIDEV